jgi:hypothetical protein
LDHPIARPDRWGGGGGGATRSSSSSCLRPRTTRPPTLPPLHARTTSPVRRQPTIEAVPPPPNRPWSVYRHHPSPNPSTPRAYRPPGLPPPPSLPPPLFPHPRIRLSDKDESEGGGDRAAVTTCDHRAIEFSFFLKKLELEVVIYLFDSQNSQVASAAREVASVAPEVAAASTAMVLELRLPDLPPAPSRCRCRMGRPRTGHYISPQPPSLQESQVPYQSTCT